MAAGSVAWVRDLGRIVMSCQAKSQKTQRGRAGRCGLGGLGKGPGPHRDEPSGEEPENTATERAPIGARSSAPGDY